MEDLYIQIEGYAQEKQLTNTMIALPLSRQLLGNVMHQSFETGNRGTTSFAHCMKAAKMLIDLHITLPKEEEDLLLAAMLCHNMLEKVHFEAAGEELIITYHLASEVLDIVKRITRPHVMSDANKKQYYKRIQENKLAVLVALADRSNLVEQLSELSMSDVNKFVHDMRNYLLPICVYAKRYYQDCEMPVHIMMEKIANLIDVTDIIVNRYQKREMSYAREILFLMEENARLRGMIEQFEVENVK